MQKKQQGPNFTIGCDPEFFLRERKTGKLISAIPYITGTKEAPMTLPLGGNIQRDNVSVEIATDPASSKDDFVRCIANTLSEAVKTLPKETEIVAIPSANFDVAELQDPDSQVFGCEPDFNAWKVSQNDVPNAENKTFRSCGAHIHVGTSGKDENSFLLQFEKKLEVVKTMDAIHGVISTVLDSGQEAIDRRQLYGSPGAHRPKDYGVEYRVLSNYWLKSPITVMLMYHLTEDALRLVRIDEHVKLIDAMTEDVIKNIIIKGDTTLAQEMIDAHIMKVISESSRYYYNEAVAKIKINDMNFHAEWGLYKKEVTA